MLDNDLLKWMKTPASQLNDLTGADLGHSSFSDLSMPVVDFAAERETNETIERHESSENVMPEEFSVVSENNANADLSPQPGPAHIPEDVTQKPVLTPEEEAATWKDYKGVLFDELNKESGFGESYDSEKKITQSDIDINVETRTETEEITLPPEPDKPITQSRSELAGYEPEPAAADERRLIKRDDRDKVSGGVPENESVSRSSKNRRIRASALAEEFRRNQKIVMEKAGRMRKKRLTLIGAFLFLLIVLTAASVAFFGSSSPDTIDSEADNRIIATDNIDENVYSADVEILSPDASNDVSPDVESVVSGDEPLVLDDIVSPDFGRESAVTWDEYLIISGDNDGTNGQNAASSDSAVSDDAASPDLARRGDLRTSAIAETTMKETRKVAAAPAKVSAGVKKTATEPKKTVNSTKRTTAPAKVTERAKRTTAPAIVTGRSRQSTETDVKNNASSIKLTGRELPKGMGSRQRRIYAAIGNENYFEAVNLSKGNLENNPNDKLSFFSLGLALYATSDYSGAAKAFYACLKFKDSELPNFMVEEFDSAESLKNLFISYPGVELLIRALELNPENKSLYLNLFLSNLKSEKPMMASDIYRAILDHAKKYGQSRSK